jgi:hypothetical protein
LDIAARRVCAIVPTRRWDMKMRSTPVTPLRRGDVIPIWQEKYENQLGKKRSTAAVAVSSRDAQFNRGDCVIPYRLVKALHSVGQSEDEGISDVNAKWTTSSGMVQGEKRTTLFWLTRNAISKTWRTDEKASAFHVRRSEPLGWTRLDCCKCKSSDR